jgi:hypothetical protein
MTNSIVMFDANNSNAPALGSIANGIAQPAGIAVNQRGELFVANATNANITVYKNGASSPSRTIADASLGAPFALAVGSDDTLVAGFNGAPGHDAAIAVFDKGATRPTRIIDVPLEKGNDTVTIDAIAIASGTMYAAVMRDAGGSQLLYFKPGSSHGIDTGISPGNGLAVDGYGSVYVGYGDSIDVFAPGTHSMMYSISGVYRTSLVAVASNGTMYVPQQGYYVCSQFYENGNVGVFAPKSQSMSASFGTPLVDPVSVALRL